MSGREAHEVVAAVAARAAREHDRVDGGGVGGGAVGGGEVGGEVGRVSALRKVEAVRRFGRPLSFVDDEAARAARLRLLLLLLLRRRRLRRRRRCVRRGGSSVISRELRRVDREIGERDDGARRRQRRLGGCLLYTSPSPRDS